MSTLKTHEKQYFHNCYILLIDFKVKRAVKLIEPKN